jgi:hypothetical protein
MTEFSPRSKGKKKANAFGLAWPPIGVFGTNVVTLPPPLFDVKKKAPRMCNGQEAAQ